MALRARGRAVIVMAKAPVAGTVKTRLIPELGAEAAASFYGACLDDVLDGGAEVGARRCCFLHPPEAVENFERRVPAHWTLFAQRGPDLAHRMVNAFEAMFAQGHCPVVMRNSDSPTLPARLLEQAFQWLESERADVVLGPDFGGGYSLVGLRDACAPLFLEVPMSTQGMEAATCRRAAELDLRVHRLQAWLDVDLPEDLARLCRELRVDEAAAQAPRTLAWLKEHFPEGAR